MEKHIIKLLIVLFYFISNPILSQTVYVVDNNKEPIYFVGIWKYFNINKKTQKVFSIITKPANDLLKEIHHRMPLTLTLDESVELLQNNNSNYFQNNIYSKIEEYFEFFQVSKFVNNPFNNSEECIKPTN